MSRATNSRASSGIAFAAVAALCACEPRYAPERPSVESTGQAYMWGDGSKKRDPASAWSSADPRPEAYFVGRYAQMEGNYGEARAAQRLALQQRPDDPYILLAMAEALEGAGDFGAARLFYIRAEEEGEESPVSGIWTDGRTVDYWTGRRMNDFGLAETVADLARRSLRRLVGI